MNISGGGQDVILELLKCTKYAVDTITFTSDTSAYTTNISHSLGEIPKYIFIESELPIWYEYNKTVSVAVLMYCQSSNQGWSGTRSVVPAFNTINYIFTSTYPVITSTSFCLNLENYIYKANTTYTIITMA